TLRRSDADEVRTTLLGQARLAADLLAARTPWPQGVDLDNEADALADRLDRRVTLISGDGRVIGESALDGGTLEGLENHGDRTETVAARISGDGVDTRRSATTAVDTMYAAARVEAGPIAFVRLALPLTRIEDRVTDLRLLALVGLGAGLLVALVAT